ncbi:MAG TPA: hypothetical protein VK194_07405, partial [Candidatus Deferrimicrobium sp.]|nr:hypothetical protein [Candidatus Deferrimicrobium sp.]
MGNRARRAFAVIAAGLLVIAVADASLAGSTVTVRVEATANPWAAGQAGPLGGGTLPAEIALPEGRTLVWFPQVSGSWSNTGPMLPADGERPVVDPPFACGAPPPCTVMAGIVQQFRVPPGATRLFLGMVDICEPAEA